MDYDFSFFLVTASFITGLVWGGYSLYLKSQRKVYALEKEPLLVEYARSFFPVVFIVLILRSFIAEPFRIPSGSMMPTLLIGDFILVNKFSYGIRLPVLNTKIVEVDLPKRGDIVVFRFPKQPTVDYIKRVIGVPGDRVAYFGKKLYINGQPISQVELGTFEGKGQGVTMSGAHWIEENLEPVKHSILITPGAPTIEDVFVVPQGQYFVMGDNRDNSNDSRYWGFVPEANLVGKAFFIWMNFDLENKGVDISRVGTALNP